MTKGRNFPNYVDSFFQYNGAPLQWVDKSRYLVVYILSDMTLRCCFDNAKRAFYHAFNVVFGKVGRFASKEVILDTNVLAFFSIRIGGLSFEQKLSCVV